MPLCENQACPSLEQAGLRCSACKYAFYCSAKCQKADWKTHKKGCAINAKLREINEAAEAREAAKPRQKPKKTHCTGCNVRFSEDYGCEDECPDCGYMACESCVCHNDRGSCFCQNTNFGRFYCEMEPQWYHRSSAPYGKAYRGDRHPVDHFKEFAEDVYEDEPRKCGNCGEVKLCFKAKYAVA